MDTPSQNPPVANEGDASPRPRTVRLSFGGQLRTRRRSLDLTLGALSKATGLHTSTLSLVESGKRLPPEPPDVQRLAEALHLVAGSREYEDFLSAASRGRSRRLLRSRRRRVGGPIQDPPAIPEPPPGGSPEALDNVGAEAGPGFAVVATGGRTTALCNALKLLLELELEQGIQSLRILTQRGSEYTIELNLERQDHHEQP